MNKIIKTHTYIELKTDVDNHEDVYLHLVYLHIS